mgnify:CR=1 FL=1
MEKIFRVEGMMCPHCEGRVRDTLNALDCVESCQVSHERDEAIVVPKADCTKEILISAVEGAGYKVISVE